jgi:hypothetical protein
VHFQQTELLVYNENYCQSELHSVAFSMNRRTRLEMPENGMIE